MRVLVTGGCGYVGSVLVPRLEAAGHGVAITDALWFGNHINSPWAPCYFDGMVFCPDTFDAIIHLAAVANDPSAELDTELAWKTNALGTMDLAEKAAAAGVKQFIYASSGSVYGVSGGRPCDESAPCVPLSAYNETKKVAERCLLSYADRMSVQIVRPGTVCGVSPRQRLDVVVNNFVAQAYTAGKIRVLGGEQKRPHIHIDDMCALYLWLLERGAWDAVSATWRTDIWNAGFENLTVLEVAKLVARYCDAKIVAEDSNDRRDYHMDSSKLLKAGFVPKKTVTDAVRALLGAFVDGRVKDEGRCYNVRHMRANGIA